MKKIIFTIIINLMIFNLFAQSQSRLWSLLPYKLDFSSSPPALSLMENNATGYIKFHNAVYDSWQQNEAKLIFYVNDEYIYNSDGVNIGVFGNSSTYGKYHETTIIPVIDELNIKKYIVATPFEYIIVNVCKHYNGYKVSCENPIELSQTYLRSTNLPASMSLLATSKQFNIEGTNIRIMFVNHLTHDANGFSIIVDLYKIEDANISYIKTFTTNDINPPQYSFLTGVHTEMEVSDIYDSENQIDKLRLAFSYNCTPDVIYINKFVIHFLEFDKSEFSSSNINLYDNKNYMYQTCYGENYCNVVHGLEFSPDGKNLYFNYSNWDFNGGIGGANPGMVRIELNDILPQSIPSLYSALPIYQFPISFFHSFIEQDYQGNLCLCHNDGNDFVLQRLSDPDLYDYQNWTSTIYNNINYSKSSPTNSNLSSFILPDQIDGENYEIAITGGCCENFNEDIEINSNEIWDDEMSIIGNVIINAGATLTIMSKIHFPDDSKITVHPGAKLIIDGGHLTNICGEMWDGIMVLGNSNLAQNESNQGVVEVINGAIIEYAHCAITASNNINTLQNGGIIKASNSTFKDCRRFISIMQYEAPQPNEKKNQCVFTNCTFECTGPLPDPIYQGKGTNEFVSLWDVQGVSFYGNIFRNSYRSIFNTFPDYNYGTGIHAIDASFVVQKVPNEVPQEPCNIPSGNPNYFVNLSKGIWYENLSGAYNPTLDRNFSVLENVFENNDIGIQTNSEVNTMIYKNDFIWDEPEYFYNQSSEIVIPPINDTVFGIKAFKSTNYHVLFNNFNWSMPEEWIEINGDPVPLTSNNIFVGTYSYEPNQSDYKSRVIGNDFLNTTENLNFQSRGSIVEVYNYDADIKFACNFYEGLKYDWWIEDKQNSPPVYKLVDQYSGVIDSAVENSFSSYNYIYQINNLGKVFNYFWNDLNKKPVSYNYPNGVPSVNADNPQQKQYFVNCNDYPCSIYELSSPPIGEKRKKDSGEEMVEGNFLSIFPVPAKDYVFINYQIDEKLKDAEMIIYNHLGQSVYHQSVESEYGFLTISKDILKVSGIYICIISNNGKNELTKKFIMTE